MAWPTSLRRFEALWRMERDCDLPSGRVGKPSLIIRIRKRESGGMPTKSCLFFVGATPTIAYHSDRADLSTKAVDKPVSRYTSKAPTD